MDAWDRSQTSLLQCGVISYYGGLFYVLPSLQDSYELEINGKKKTKGGTILSSVLLLPFPVYLISREEERMQYRS